MKKEQNKEISFLPKFQIGDPIYVVLSGSIYKEYVCDITYRHKIGLIVYNIYTKEGMMGFREFTERDLMDRVFTKRKDALKEIEKYNKEVSKNTEQYLVSEFKQIRRKKGKEYLSKLVSKLLK